LLEFGNWAFPVGALYGTRTLVHVTPTIENVCSGRKVALLRAKIKPKAENERIKEWIGMSILSYKGCIRSKKGLIKKIFCMKYVMVSRVFRDTVEY